MREMCWSWICEFVYDLGLPGCLAISDGAVLKGMLGGFCSRTFIYSS